MDGHDLGRERGGLVSAMSKLTMPLFVLALHDDQMISASAVEEMLDSAKEAGMKCEIDWIKTKHGHDSFFIEWPQVLNWLNKLVCEVVQ
jgi:homoserine O-acetyltransferase